MPERTAATAPRIKDVSPGLRSPENRATTNLYSGRDGLRQPSDRLIRFGTDPLRFSYGDRDWIRRNDHGSYYPRHGYPYYGYSGYRTGHHHYHRPYYYPRSCYPYYGFYPWYGVGLGFGYAYSTVYLAEPYVTTVYAEPQYVAPSYAPGYVATDTYTGGTTTYSAPQAQPAPSEPLPETTGEYQALEPSEEQRAVVMEGNAAFGEGRFDEARSLYSRAVMSDERDGYAKVLYAWASFAVGDYDTAAASLRRALLTTRDLVDYPMDLRTMYKDTGVLPAQTERLARFVAENPQDADARLLLGYLHYSVGEADRAEAIFAELAQRDANDAVAAQLRDAAGRAAKGQTQPPPRPDGQPPQ